MQINPNSHAKTHYDWSEVETPITDELFAEWIEALKSGVYKQTTGRLSRETEELGIPVCSYCCLGVLAKMEDKLDKVYDLLGDYLYTDGSFDDKDGHFNGGVYQYLPERLQTLIGEVNDASESFTNSVKLLTIFFTKTTEEITEMWGEDFPDMFPSDLIRVIHDHE